MAAKDAGSKSKKSESQSSESEQQRLQELLIQSQVYQKNLQDMTRKMATLESSIAEIEDTINTLKEFPKIKEQESLVPLGSGVFVKATLTDKENLLVSYGGGMVLEKPVAEAKTYLEEQKENLKKTEETLRYNIAGIQEKLDAMNNEASGIYAKLQKSQPK